MYMQIFLTFLFFFSQHWMLFLASIPLFCLHLKMLVTKEYKFHCITYKEYKQGGRKEKNERFLKWKTVFHAIMTLVLFAMFILNFTNLVSYKIGFN